MRRFTSERFRVLRSRRSGFAPASRGRNRSECTSVLLPAPFGPRNRQSRCGPPGTTHCEAPPPNRSTWSVLSLLSLSCFPERVFPRHKRATRRIGITGSAGYAEHCISMRYSRQNTPLQARQVGGLGRIPYECRIKHKRRVSSPPSPSPYSYSKKLQSIPSAKKRDKPYQHSRRMTGKRSVQGGRGDRRLYFDRRARVRNGIYIRKTHSGPVTEGVFSLKALSDRHGRVFGLCFPLRLW